MRDLLTVLGIDKVTVVGHSFGGGVAMQFAYQFPERTERLVLVASGGLGPEVSPAIRAVTTPGFHQVMGVLTLPGIRHVGMAGMRAPGPRRRCKPTRDLDEVADDLRLVQGPGTPGPRSATWCAPCVDWQRPDRHDGRPRLPHRGDADGGRLGPRRPGDPGRPRQQRRGAGSRRARVEIIPNAGHFPHKDHPQRFAKVVHDFIRTTQPATYSRARFRDLLKSGAPTVGTRRALRAVADVCDAPAAATRRRSSPGSLDRGLDDAAGVLVTPSDGSGVAALLLHVGDRGGVVDAVRRERLLDPSTADLAGVGERLERLHDHRLRVDVEEAARGRAGVGEAEPVGAEHPVVRRAPSGRSAAARRACSPRPRRPGPGRRSACR